jgi:hypothetical protein
MIYIITSIIAGFLTKITDEYSERDRKTIFTSIGLGLFYGIAIGFCVFLNAGLLSIVAGVSIGNSFAGKIDKIEHLIALATIFCFVYTVMQSYPIDPALMVLFSIASFLDETLKEISKKVKGIAKTIFENRLLVPISTLPMITINPNLFIFMIAFDIGYRIANFIQNKRQ